MNYFQAIPNKVIVETNLDSFDWSYGLCMPKTSRDEFNSSLIKLSIEVVKGNLWTEDELREIQAKGKFHYFSGDQNQDKIFYDRNFLFKMRLQYELSGLTTNHIKIRVNKSYMRFVTHRFMNVHSIGYILTDIVNLKLLKNGLCPLHCSAVADNDGVAKVIFAPPNTGKTLTSMKLCIESNFNYMAEDLAVTDGVNIFSVPWTSTFRYYGEIDKSKSTKFISYLTDKVALVELLGIGKVESIEKYIPKSRIKFSASVGDLVILERGVKSLKEELSDSEFEQCIHTLDRYEFNYMRAPAIIAFAYFNPDVNIQDAQDAERKILKKLVNSANAKLVARAPSALDYPEMLRKI